MPKKKKKYYRGFAQKLANGIRGYKPSKRTKKNCEKIAKGFLMIALQMLFSGYAKKHKDDMIVKFTSSIAKEIGKDMKVKINF